MRRFWIAAVGAAIPTAFVTVYIGLNSENTRIDVVRDAGQAISALAAFATCAWLAGRSTGGRRRAWGLIALSGLAAVVVEIAEALYTLGAKTAPSLLGASDYGIAAALPLAIAGLLFFPPTRRFATGRRTALDVAMIALSLVFIGSALSLPDLFARSASPSDAWIGLSSLAVDFVLLTVVSWTLRRSEDALRPRVLLVLGGLSAIAVADCAAVVVAASGQLGGLREVFGSGSTYGFALVALAPLWPQREPAGAEEDMPLWPDLIPYIGVGAVALTAIVISIRHQPMTGYAAAAAGGLAAILLGSHLLSRSEARDLLLKGKRVQARLQEREAMLNSVIDHAPQGVASISLERRITNANPRLASMLYAPLPVLIGSVTDAFLPEDYVSRVFRSFAANGDGSAETYESDCQARRADGSQLWVHWSATPIRRTDGSIDYFMATFEDVTAKRESEELSAANLAQLEKLNRLKSEFVSMVSHEFRTALVGIQGFSELIRDQEMEASEMKTLAGEIYDDSQRLSRMITDMLDFDRLEAGKLKLDLRQLDINDLVREAVEHASVSTRQHTFEVELQQGLPLVLGDQDRLTQVLTNLLSNAIKYSPRGGEIRICTRVNGGCAEVGVIDHGNGIPPEFISRLFGRYERYEDKHAGKIIGTGLGLAITRQIVEMHGGRIAVESVVGKGSEFRFTVPFATTDAAVTRSA
ncbi:MAG TPA: PAS domain-containing sensor histidine kinase [Candidatus Dormibacteraeota bacterium]|nr:PAS domain-containing sensor histidine kinase [Candidatus Dormibacteraeota bacterium]